MNNYFELLKKLAPMDRCHCGPEMDLAYEELTNYYNGSRKIYYPCGEKIYYWEIPPYWECNHATLKDSSGNIIATKSRNNLEVFSYSPSFKGEISLKELDKHLLSDPNRPEAILFHFRNQYRHWDPVWGFSIPHNVRENLKDEKYYVSIDSNFDNSKNMVQADYHHKGKLKDEFLFMGHFDHPSMVDDGLSGCIAAFEIINRLKGKDTKYSYRAFASVEIVGSVAYLAKESDIKNNLKEALFLGFTGIDSDIVYQQSFEQKSKFDEAVKHIFQYGLSKSLDKDIYKHRELAGNDENVFDSVGYKIPAGTLMRSPFLQYHTQFDNINNTNKDKIEEIINLGLKLIDIIDNDCYIGSNYNGIPCLSNPDIDLYLNPELMSGIINNDDFSKFGLDEIIYSSELNYIKNNKNLLYHFMGNVLRLADGKHRLMEICNLSKIPFFFGLAYVKALETKGVINLIDV